MKKLSIKLDQDYKSFIAGFFCDLEGDLIILSGVNGSGKSQLIDIIHRQRSNNKDDVINATIKINDEEIKNKDISFRSFKENINPPETQSGDISKIISYKNQIWQYYSRFHLDINQNELKEFQRASKDAKELLIEKFGEEKFNNNKITQEDINNLDLGNFTWSSDDIFSNIIGDLFYAHAKKVFDGTLACGEIINKKFDASSVGKPPWIKLNELFSELGLEYRFKNEISDYFIKKNDYQLNENPRLYQLKENGDIDVSDPRNISDLSDGEKAIISLIFAFFNDVKYRDKKILLLDEFDATFNPSLTKAFFKLVEKYFIEKNILVVMATHSPVTISLAPEYAGFYEVFNKIKSKKRILSVQRDEYSELRRVNEEFYKKTENQPSRAQELQKNEKDLEKIETEIATVKGVVLFVEGDYDVNYINKAGELLIKKEFLSKITIKDANGFGGLDKIWKHYNSKLSEVIPQKIILLYDCDTDKMDDKKGELYKKVIPNISMHLIRKGIENLFSDDIIIKARRNKKAFIDYTPSFERDVRGISEVVAERYEINVNEKNNLCKWICENATKEDFKNFEKIFEILESIK
jgi:ABC-type multidrug transport system ATPase subunit